MNKLNMRVGTTEERICELENRSECDTKTKAIGTQCLVQMANSGQQGEKSIDQEAQELH